MLSPTTYASHNGAFHSCFLLWRKIQHMYIEFQFGLWLTSYFLVVQQQCLAVQMTPYTKRRQISSALNRDFTFVCPRRYWNHIIPNMAHPTTVLFKIEKFPLGLRISADLLHTCICMTHRCTWINGRINRQAWVVPLFSPADHHEAHELLFNLYSLTVK